MHAWHARGLGVMVALDESGTDIYKSYFFGGGNDPRSAVGAGPSGASGYSWAAVDVPFFGGYTPKLIETSIDFKARDANPQAGDTSNQSSGGPLTTSDAIAFVTALYHKYYHRGPDASGLEFWSQQLTSGAKDRATVERAFATSPDMSPDPTQTLEQYLAAQGVARDSNSTSSSVFGIPLWVAIPGAVVLAALALGGNNK